MPLLQHGLKSRRFHFQPETHARLQVITPLPQFLENALAYHLLFQPAQRPFHRLLSFKSDLNQSVLSFVLGVAGPEMRAR